MPRRRVRGKLTTGSSAGRKRMPPENASLVESLGACGANVAVTAAPRAGCRAQARDVGDERQRQSDDRQDAYAGCPAPIRPPAASRARRRTPARAPGRPRNSEPRCRPAPQPSPHDPRALLRRRARKHAERHAEPATAINKCERADGPSVTGRPLRDEFGDAVILVHETTARGRRATARRGSCPYCTCTGWSSRTRPAGWQRSPAAIACSWSNGPAGRKPHHEERGGDDHEQGRDRARQHAGASISASPCGSVRGPARPASISRKPCSSRMRTPSSSALRSFDPASAPTTSSVVLLDTESVTVAPAARAASRASSRDHAGERPGDHRPCARQQPAVAAGLRFMAASRRRR